MEDAITTAFAPLIGRACWGVERGQFGILSFQFGSPSLFVREPSVTTSSSEKVRKLLARRIVKPRGEWNLFINFCHWRIVASGQDFANDESPQQQMDAAANLLDGQRLIGFTLDAPSRKTAFAFDLGATVTTWPYPADEEELWSLYLPGEQVLTYRADGLFSLGAANTALDKEVWQDAVLSVSIP